VPETADELAADPAHSGSAASRITAEPPSDASCPICGSALRASHIAGLDRLVTGDGPFTVMECTQCEYGVTFPQLSEEELAPYYSTDYYAGFCEYAGRVANNPLYRLREAFRHFSAARRYERPPYHVEGLAPGRVLDVGCGAGDLLEHFARKGWDTYGIDPSASAVEAAAARGARVHRGTLRDQPWQPGSFELITFQHALEHIPDPVDALERARSLLVPGGLIAIAVPNWSCWQRRFLFRDRWSPLDLPRHQQHFSVRALERAATRLGLRTRRSGTTSNAPVVAYSLLYVIAGRLVSGWRLWLSYALGMLAFPFVLIGDRIGGGDCAYIVMELPPEPSQVHQSSGESAGNDTGPRASAET
jgi:SAM-dependent methyltransferase